MFTAFLFTGKFFCLKENNNKKLKCNDFGGFQLQEVRKKKSKNCQIFIFGGFFLQTSNLHPNKQK
jgi:hypothetical protein